MHAENTNENLYKLKADFFSKSSIYTLMSLLGIFEKILDQEMQCCFILTPSYFEHPLNVGLSAAAVSLAMFHNKTTTSKKQNNDYYYSKNDLPRVTYLGFTGVYSK